MVDIYTYIYSNAGERIIDNSGNFVIYSTQSADVGGFDYRRTQELYLDLKFPIYGIKRFTTFDTFNVVGIKTFLNITKADAEGILSQNIFRDICLEGKISKEALEFFDLLGIKSNQLVDYTGIIGTAKKDEKIEIELNGLKSVYIERKNIIEGVKQILTTDVKRIEAHKLMVSNLDVSMVGIKDIRKLVLSILNIEIN